MTDYADRPIKVFSPVCNCPLDKAVISFRLRHPDLVTVTIVDSHGHVVDTLATDKSERKGSRVTFRWDGRTNGGVAPNGSVYRPQVHLSNGRRTILMPSKITIDSSPPKVVSASDGGGILIAGARGLPIRYVLGEHAQVSVYVRGRRVLIGRKSLTALGAIAEGSAGLDRQLIQRQMRAG